MTKSEVSLVGTAVKPVVVEYLFGDRTYEAKLLYGMGALEGLKTLPDASVHVCCTSPPYWGLRDYGTAPQVWGDGWVGSLGLEPTPEIYVEHLVEVFREVKRVLRSDGTLWLNLGDTYAASPKGNPGALSRGLSNQGRCTARANAHRTRSTIVGDLKAKDLVGIPWMVAFALRKRGWYLRSNIIWSKPWGMPEAVKDRPTRAHEDLFLLAKKERYFYDAAAIAEAAKDPRGYKYEPGTYREMMVAATLEGKTPDSNRQHVGNTRVNGKCLKYAAGLGESRNVRSVWRISPHAYPGAHFATFPPELVSRMIRAGSSVGGCCPTCGSPLRRAVLGTRGKVGASGLGWDPTCKCFVGNSAPCTVLDPFSGSGTTGAVAVRNGRNYVGLDVQEKYLPLARARILGMAAPEEAVGDEAGGVFDMFGGRG